MIERPRQAVILAGGRGTRLRPITDALPKALVPFHGKPFLGYIVDMLREQGFERVLMLLGYMPQAFVDHFGDGSDYGVEIDFDVTGADDLTCHRVSQAIDKIDDLFMLMYCDNYWPMRFDDMWASYLAAGAPAQITVYANSDGYSRDSVVIGDDGFVKVFDRGRTSPNLRGVEISYAILRKDVVVPLLPSHQELFEVAIYPPLAERRELHSYWSGHRYYSVGSHERLALTEAFLSRKPAVILDRDGVLNKRPPKSEYVRRPQDVEWIPGAKEALRLFADNGWRVIIVTNQAGVGRGLMTQSDLDAVHDRIRQDAHEAGGRIDAIYTCPHAWDAGCECRKPKPGMLFQAQRDFSLDLTRITFVGDDRRDAEAAISAGARPLLLGSSMSLLDAAHQLLEAARPAEVVT